MKNLKTYCGRMLMESNGVYYCVDVYSGKIHAKGTLEECNKEFDNYVKTVTNKD